MNLTYWFQPNSYRIMIPMTIAFCFITTLAFAQLNQEPDELKGIEIIEHLDAELPLDAVFKDANGNVVKLGDSFDGEHPVILTLVYYRCPMLCGLLLDGVMQGIKEIPLTVGKDYNIVTLSFDPLETSNMAKVNQQQRLKEYGRAEAREGWPFLTGKKDQIVRVADSVGFGYKWNESRKEYAHVAVIMICTPDGKISRYLYGIEFNASTLRLSLVEAAQGKIGTTVDKIFLTCFRYDPSDSQYAPVAILIMRLGGIITLLLLSIFLGGFWLNERRKKIQVATTVEEG